MAAVRKIDKYELGKKLIPEKIYKLDFKRKLEELYQKLYFNNLNYTVVTNSFFLSILLTILAFIFLYPKIYFTIEPYMNDAIGKFVVLFVFWFLLNLLMYYGTLLGYFFYKDSRFKKAETEIEKDLPEFIDNLVSNIKGGISLEKALLKSVRIEQKALLREVTLINEKIMMGLSVEDALKQFSERFDSPVISRTFFLILEGIKGGGNLAAPLERISENLKRVYALEEEIKSNSGGFAVVITSITLVVAPVLFALAITLLTFIGDLFGLLSEQDNEFLSVSAIPDEFYSYLITFSYAMIALITLFSSLITSQLKNEKTYEAVKYVPIYIIISILIYKGMSAVLLGFFSGIIQ